MSVDSRHVVSWENLVGIVCEREREKKLLRNVKEKIENRSRINMVWLNQELYNLIGIS